jgi:hypothetical protein
MKKSTPTQAKPKQPATNTQKAQATKKPRPKDSGKDSLSSKTGKQPPIAPKRPRGRPIGACTKKTPELCDEIIQRISEGETLASICRDDDRMPQRQKVYDWMDKDDDLARRFARARIKGFDAIAEETVRIADGKDNPGEDASIRRVRVETRLKLLAKWDPKRYGERIEQSIEIETGPKTLESIRERALRIGRALSIAAERTPN